MKFRFYFSWIIGLFSTVTIGQTTLSIQPSSVQGKDAILHGLPSEVNINYGVNNQFSANAWTYGSTPGRVRSIVDFDLSAIPANAVIVSAALSLYSWDSEDGFGQHSNLSGSNASYIKRVTSAWNENSVTWNTQPTVTAVNQVAVPASTSSNQDFLNIDVTNMMQDMINNQASSHGFMLELQNEVYFRKLNFASSDHNNSSLHPKIVIIYNEQLTCITLQPESSVGKDAILHGLESETSINYGHNSQFSANAWTYGGIPGTVRSIIDFDLSALPSNATIISADLTLYSWDSSTGFGQHSSLSGSTASYIKRITSPWSENTVTWNTQPSVTSNNQVMLASTTGPNQNFLNIDVSSMLQDMINNPSSSYGFMLELQNETYYRKLNFASSDHPNSNLHPKIVICFSEDILEIKEFDFTLFPTPAEQSISIYSPELEGQRLNVQIFDTGGKLVFISSDYLLNYPIDISMLSRGLYLVRVITDKSSSTKKLVIQ